MRAFGLRDEVHRYYPGYEAWVSMEGGRLLVHDVWWPYGEFRSEGSRSTSKPRHPPQKSVLESGKTWNVSAL